MPSASQTQDRQRAALVFGIMLVAYLATLAPTVTLEQSGAMAVAADHGGIGKFPGFPLWHLAAATMTRLVPGLTYRGHPNPALATNLLSALSAAIACASVAWTVSRINRRMTPPHATTTMGPVLFAAPVSTGLLLGFSPALWSQAVITETHAFTAMATGLFLALLVDRAGRHSPNRITGLAFLFGLLLSVSPLLVLLAPAMILAVAWSSRRQAMHLVVAILVTLILPPLLLTAPDWTTTASLAIAWLTAGLALAGFLPQTRTILLGHAAMTAGLLPYLGLPLAAAIRPPMNMGAAYTWEGFRHLVTRGQYERLDLLRFLREPGHLGEEALRVLHRVQEAFPGPLAWVGLAAIAALFVVKRERGGLAVTVAAVVGLAGGLLVGLYQLPPDLQTRWITRPLYIPLHLAWSVCIGGGWVILYRVFARRNQVSMPGTTV
jgi:hypothetical protein